MIYLEELVKCSENLLCENLSGITKNTLASITHQERLSKSLFRAAYVLGNEVPIFEKIVSKLPNHEYQNLAVDALKEKSVSFMIAEKISHISIEEIKLSIININSINQILCCVAKLFDIKFVIYNNMKLVAIVMGNCISFNCVISLGMLFESINEPKTFAIDRIADPEALRTFEELDCHSDDDSVIEEVLKSTTTDEHRREHLLYPHSGTSLVYLRNNIFHDNTCLEHANDLFPICIESKKKQNPVY